MNAIKSLLIFGFLMTISIGLSAQQSVPEQERQDRAEILRMQDSLIDAYLHHDYAVLDRVLSDDYTYVDDDGFVLNKQQILDAFNSEDDKVNSYKRQDDRVRLFGDTAIVTYHYQTQETYKGHEVGGDLRTTRIFAKRNGRWVIVGAQDTKVNPHPTFTALNANEDENALIKLEGEWARSTADPNQIARFIEENTTPDYTYTSSDGTVMTKTELIENSRQDRAGTANATEMQARVYGNTGVVMGIWTQGSRHLASPIPTFEMHQSGAVWQPKPHQLWRMRIKAGRYID